MRRDILVGLIVLVGASQGLAAEATRDEAQRLVEVFHKYLGAPRAGEADFVRVRAAGRGLQGVDRPRAACAPARIARRRDRRGGNLVCRQPAPRWDVARQRLRHANPADDAHGRGADDVPLERCSLRRGVRSGPYQLHALRGDDRRSRQRDNRPQWRGSGALRRADHSRLRLACRRRRRQRHSAADFTGFCDA